MSLVVGGYTLHYFDERTGESVLIPLDDMNVELPKLRLNQTAIITYDEAGEVTAEMLERAKAYAETHDYKRVVLLDMDVADVEARAVAYSRDHPEMLGPLEATLDLDRRALSRALSRAFYRTALEKVDVRPDPGPPRHDWHDRRKPHRNRKRRAWR